MGFALLLWVALGFLALAVVLAFLGTLLRFLWMLAGELAWQCRKPKEPPHF